MVRLLILLSLLTTHTCWLNKKFQATLLSLQLCCIVCWIFLLPKPCTCLLQLESLISFIPLHLRSQTQQSWVWTPTCIAVIIARDSLTAYGEHELSAYNISPTSFKHIQAWQAIAVPRWVVHQARMRTQGANIDPNSHQMAQSNIPGRNNSSGLCSDIDSTITHKPVSWVLCV